MFSDRTVCTLIGGSSYDRKTSHLNTVVFILNRSSMLSQRPNSFSSSFFLLLAAGMQLEFTVEPGLPKLLLGQGLIVMAHVMGTDDLQCLSAV